MRQKRIPRFIKFISVVVLAGFLACGLSTAFASEGNIDSANKYAWSENSGWGNFRPTHSGGYVNKNYLEGYVWCENAGWVRLGTGSGGVAGDPPQYANTNATNYGVNNDGSGNLSGYAWSENAGWINFNPTHSQVAIDTSTGEFDGYAWSENLGWIHFQNASPVYNVQTNWPTVTWDGSTSTDWATGSNWDSGAAPSNTDNVVIPDAATTPNNPTVSSGAVCNNLTIEADGILNGGTDTLTVSGNWDSTGTFNPATGGVAFNATTGTLTIANNVSSFNNVSFDDSTGDATFSLSQMMDINGNFSLTDGIFDQNGQALTVGGNWAFAGGSFLSAPSVTFDTQAIETTISGETTFNNLSCTTNGKTMKFTQGTNQTVNGTLTFTGGSGVGEKITLVSTVNTQKWDIIFPNGAQTVSYVDVRDSDANTNIVTCYNSTDSGNNNTSWVFNTVAITSPTAGKTIGTTPVVIGTAGAGDTVVIRDKDNTTVATTTADVNGNFRVTLTTALAVSPPVNSLTPFVGAVPGATVDNLTVAANPNTNQVPTIVSPAEDEEILGATPTITGRGLAGEVVTVTAKDSNGSLPLTDVATGVVDGTGNYSIASSDYVTDLVNGENYLTVTVGGVTSAIRTVSLTDPFGIVFDSVSNNPIGGAIVTIYDSAGAVLVPGVAGAGGCMIAAADANPQTTAADGAYSFFCADANGYTITVSAAGYTYPSARTSFPAGRVIVNGSKGEVFNVAGVIIEMDHPMDSNSALLKITKDANKKEVAIGDIITYTVTIKNETASDVTSVYLEDKIPAGFKYLDGKAILDGAQISDPTGNRPLTFNIGTISTGQTRTLKYQLVVGSGVTFGNYENKAFAKSIDGTIISNHVTETVKVIPDALFDLGTVIGKVFFDKDGDCMQDVPKRNSPVVAESGIANVEIVTEDGTVITTDKYGRFHLKALMPGRHLFRLDESTLPEGAYLTTDKVVIVDITPGILSKVNFGVRIEEGSPAIAPFRVSKDRAILKPRLNVACYQPRGSENCEFRIFTNYQLFIDTWILEILDKNTKQIIKEFRGIRDNIFEPIYWNANEKNKAYLYRLKVFGKGGKEDIAGDREFVVKSEELLDSSEDEPLKEWLQKESTLNSLQRQVIPIKGELVKVTGAGYKSIRVLKDKDLKTEVVVTEAKVLEAKDILESGIKAETDSDKGVDIILPMGEYEIEVNRQAEGKAYSKHVKVGDDYLFFVAMGDIKTGYTFNKGDIEPVGHDDKFNEGFWHEGRATYYLKGKIKGKYLITSSFDSSRHQKELFKNLDPDKHYPVYGDESSVSYRAQDTQGMLYLLIEWDQSSAIWGNYQTQLTDTEFAQFNRTLYGGKLHLETVSTTKYGEPTTKLIAFKARAKQRAAHNEFTGTGGSLYYLKHKDVVEGSDKVKVEVRDKITGLVLATKEMKEGVDYDIDYSSARIIFWKPISYISESSSIISGHLLGGNPVYVVMDYEYETKDKYDEGTYGARIQQSLTDYVSIGTTYVSEELETENYELKGADATFYYGDNMRLKAEYAESKSEALGSFISTDGGVVLY